MKKILLAPVVAVLSVLGWASVASATPPAPVVDVEAETTGLFETNAPIVVGVVLALAAFGIVMALLKGGVSKVIASLRKAF